MSKQSTHSSKAFTLIELLVVIAIVSGLVALILPSLKAARETALAVKCQAGMKQFGLAWSSYAGDWKGTIPGQYYQWQKNIAFQRYLGADTRIRAANLVACPANPFRADSWTQQYNYYCYGFVSLHNIRYPSEGFWACETPINNSNSYTMPVTITGTSSMWFGHPNLTATNLHYDMHVAARPQQDIPVINDIGSFRYPGYLKFWQPNMNSRNAPGFSLPWI